MKILICFGTRPEAIKLAPLVKELESRSWAEVQTCSTGQHREMLKHVLDLFNITPDYNLDLMKPNQTLSSLTARAITGLDDVLRESKPDLVIVQGDTTTTLCAALAAFYNKIPVAHVEAGLRTDNRYSPFPEEINRRMVSSLVTYHFPPTEQAKRALLNEDYPEDSIHVVGNTVIDALLQISAKVLNENSDISSVFPTIDFSNRIVLITGHRRESFGEGFEHFCRALKQLANSYPEVEFVYPVHLNPNVQKPVHAILENIQNIHLLKPLDYKDFILLMNSCYIVITDSGGIQEEAPSLGKPVIVTRDTTERQEAIEAGVAVLVGTNEIDIIAVTQNLLDDENLYNEMSSKSNPYGDGDASQKIANIIEREVY